jgi:hypothetical protein
MRALVWIAAVVSTMASNPPTNLSMSSVSASVAMISLPSWRRSFSLSALIDAQKRRRPKGNPSIAGIEIKTDALR